MKTLDLRPAALQNVATYVATEGGMNFATVRDLKNRTSELLRRVAAGKDILITSHGKPVAMLHGMTQDDLEDWVLSHDPWRKSIEDAYREGLKYGGTPLEDVIRDLKAKLGGGRQKRGGRKRRWVLPSGP